MSENAELRGLRARIDLVDDPGFYGHELARIYAQASSYWHRMTRSPDDVTPLMWYHSYVAQIRYLLDTGNTPGVFEGAWAAGYEARMRIVYLAMDADELLARRPRAVARLSATTDPALRLIDEAVEMRGLDRHERDQYDNRHDT